MCNSVLSKERQSIVAEHDEPYNTSGLPSFVGQVGDGFLDCRCKSCWGVSLLHFVKKLSFFKSGKFTRQDLDGFDLLSSSASMLEIPVTKEECESISTCTKRRQTQMWAACAKKYEWQILDTDVNMKFCTQNQITTSNLHFVKCHRVKNKPNVKWSSNGGEARCTRFDNNCMEKLKQLSKSGKLDTKSPDNWQGQEENKNALVVRFIKLGQ